MPMINCEVNLILTWSEEYVITDTATLAAGAQGNLPEIRAPMHAKLAIIDTKLYVPTVTLSIQDGNKLLQQLKQDSNKLSNEINADQKCLRLSRSNNKLFVLSLETEDDRISFFEYYTPGVQIKDFNLLIDGKSFFETLIKNKKTSL